jgi:hypothetical protein
MININSRPLVRISLAMILISSMFLLATPAAALGRSTDKNKETDEAASTSKKIEVADPDADPSSAMTEAKSPNIAYVLYNNGVSFRPETAEVAAPFEPPKPIDPNILTVKTIVPKSFPALPPPAVSTAPMTAGEKFNYFARSSFFPPGPYLSSTITGLYGELPDNNEGKEDTFEDYLADSMTRAARSFGNRVANNFFEKFALATIFKQDPRYHRSNKRGTGAKIGYAVSRLFITQGDRSGDQFNISFLLGGLLGAGVSTVWQRDENQTVGEVFGRWGTHLFIRGVSNIITEFVGGQ